MNPDDPRDWMVDAACRAYDPDMFVPDSEKKDAYKPAQRVCRTECKVRAECLKDALKYEEGKPAKLRHGVWGGTTPARRFELAGGAS